MYFCFFLCPRASLVYSLYAFRPALWGSLLIYALCVFANQKKKIIIEVIMLQSFVNFTMIGISIMFSLSHVQRARVLGVYCFHIIRVD